MLSVMAFTPLRAYVDESIRGRTYLMAAVVVLEADVPRSRRVIKGWVLRGQRKIHFVSESHARRDQILQSLVRLPISVRSTTGGGRDEHARAAALRQLALDLIAMGVMDVTIESRGARDVHDRRTLAQLLPGREPRLSYRHLGSHDEPMLWVADACAWSAGAGGRYGTLVDTLRTRR